VESPAKAKTIAGYLRDGYTVDASIGHIPNIEKKSGKDSLGIDIENGYTPHYVVSPEKRGKVAELKAALKEVDELFLATDEDREGEAISWHLLEVLQPKVPVRRMVFHEITREAIARAVEDTRELDMDLVNAQDTRRVIDRLYGYEVSPVLWRKIAPGLSAGRVQSVAVRFCVERERERMAFLSAAYWDLRGVFSTGTADLEARLVSVDGTRVATGRDFDDRGALTNATAVHLDEAGAHGLREALLDASFVVRSVEDKPGTRKPQAPFMTSTLQQEGSRKLRWGAQRTMRVAQGLYERGYITYMRTDSTTLSESALNAARAQARQLYGADHVSEVPRRYDRKVKNAQEAHEAIRPAGDVFRTPGAVAGELNGDDFALYDLIWKRTIASQMVDARVSTTTIRLGATASDGRDAEFSASGTVVVFPGFLAAYEEGRDDQDESDAERRLPLLAVADRLSLREMLAEDHHTSPKARYTEATLVKALEENGIGRPSTYASIINTIIDRGYVTKRGSALVPSFLAFAVVQLLEQHFGQLVDYQFTASMEEVLDSIAAGDVARLSALENFYRGEDAFPGLQTLLSSWGDIDARAVSEIPIPGTSDIVRVGRYGPYLERPGDGPDAPVVRANVPLDLAPDELTGARVQELFDAPSGERELGTDPESGRSIIAKSGRFGPYVTEVLPEGTPTTGKKAVKPRTGSLLSTMSLDTVTLDDALRLLALPRYVGDDPEKGAIVAQNGRFGPYLTRGDDPKDSRSLASEEEIFTVTLEQALALYAEPKRRRGASAPAGPLRTIGVDPSSGREITVKDGRFGPYVTDGETNATLRRADDPMSVSLERAADLIAEKRAKDPAPKKRAAKKTVAKRTVTKTTVAKSAVATTTVAKKSAAKKTTAKKSAAKKTAAKKSSSTPS